MAQPLPFRLRCHWGRQAVGVEPLVARIAEQKIRQLHGTTHQSASTLATMHMGMWVQGTGQRHACGCQGHAKGQATFTSLQTSQE